MAEKLKKQADGILEPVSAVNIGMMRQDVSYPAPQQLRIFNLIFKMTGAGLDLHYDGGNVVDVPDETNSWASFDAWLVNYLQTTNDPTPYQTRYHDPATSPGRPRTELSLLAPFQNLDGEDINRVFYLIRVRSKRGDGGNVPDKIRFSTIADPFSYSTIDVPNNIDDKVFVNPRLIYPNLVLPTENLERPPDNRYATTNQAGFMFDRTALQSESQFGLRFNINLEVASRQRQYGENRFRSFIPIIIDPDIGHPGGNNTGP